MKILKFLIFAIFTLSFVNLNAQTPFFECDFESNSGGFVNNSNNPDCDWKIGTGSTAAVVIDGVHKTGPTSAHSGNHYAYVDVYHNQPESGMRISFEKTFDLSTLQNPMLSFWTHIYTDSQDDKPQIIVSVKRKNSFEFSDIYKSIELENTNEWQKINVCLSKSGITQSNSSDIVIAIQYLCKTTPYANFAIDDIKIENFSLEVETIDAKCFGQESGQIDIDVIGGGPKYKYSIDGGDSYTDWISDNEYSYPNVIGAIYHVKVLDQIGQCYASKDIKVKAPDSIKFEVKTADIKCFGDENGSITIAASNSIEPYSYSINGKTGTFSSSNIFENLKGGPYTVVVKNANGCFSREQNVVVGQDVKLSIVDVVHTDVEKCYGDKTAMVTITAQYAKNGPIGYSVDNGQTYYNSNTIYNLPAGKYKVKIRDKNLCEVSYPEFEITQPEQFVYNDFSTLVTNVENCFGDSTGVIVASAKGGTEPYQYSINKTVTYQDSEIFDHLVASSYQIFVKDNNNCVAKSQIIEITQPTELKVKEVVPFDVQTCYGENTGYIEVRGMGGTPTYQYSLDGTNYQTSITMPDLYTGWYRPYVKDRKGCVVRFADSVFIDQPDQIELLEASEFGEIKCNGDKTMGISALANGGTLPYTYTIKNWLSNNKTMGTKSFCRFTNLGAGDYVVQAKDVNGCKTEIKNIKITQPDPVVINSVETSDVSCYMGQDGKIIIQAEGGTTPYYYGYSITGRNGYNIGENSTIEGVPFGLYDVKVTDANNCFAIEKVVEVKQPSSLGISDVSVTDVSTCYGDSNGKIVITTNNGGVGPYMYSIDNGQTYQTPQTFENLPFGTRYLIKIKDSKNCEQAYDRAVTVNQPSQVKIQEQLFKNIEGCNGVENGEISIYVTGGNSPYSFSVDNGESFQTLANQRFRFENLKAGSYQVVVKDKNNCGDRGSNIIISQPEVMKLESVETIDEECFGQSIGQAIITISGGEPTQYNNPYYFVLEGDPSIYWNKGHFDGLEAGVYNVKAYDKFECSISTSFTIKEPAALKIDNVTHTDVSTCNGDRTGMIEFSSVGGVSPFTYTISSIHSEKENEIGKFDNLPASSYSLVVTDANGCQDFDYLDILQPERIRFTRTLDKEILCYGDEGASFSVFASGGTAPYSYSVDGGKTFPYSENVFENFPKGDYQITVRDKNNCLADKIELLAVTQPTELNLSWQKFDINCSTSNDGQIIVSCSGGTKAYQYSIDGGNTFVDSPIFKNLLEGVYKIKVVDYHGCQIESEEMEIIRPENKAGFSVDVVEGCTPLTVVITQDHQGLTNYDLGDGHKVENCTGPYTYTYQNNTDHNITYQITAALEMLNMSGCRDTAYNQVTVFNRPIVDFRLDYDTVTYPNVNATFVNISRDVSQAFWDFGDGNTSNNIEEFSHEYPKCGSYDIKLVESNGRCQDSLQKTFVIASKKMFLNILSDVIEGCEPLKVTFEQSSVNVDSCQWFFGDSTYTGTNVDKVVHQFENPGQYVVTLVGYGDCESQVKTTKRINVFSKPTAGFIQNKDTLYAGQYLRLENNSKSSDFFFWDFGDGETSTEPEPIHKYEKSGDFNISLVVTAAEGSCADTSTVESAICVINNPIVVFPNAFTPNGDGINDVFAPVHGELTKFEMHIFNRNGILVKRVTDVDEGWDGTNLNGVKCPPGVYAYKSTSVLRDNSFYLHHGWVMLVR